MGRITPGGDMGCILNYCSSHIPADLLVVAYYGTFVLVAVGLSYLAESKDIRTAASLIGMGWVFGIFSFFYLNTEGYFLVAVMYDTIIAYHFWRMAKVSIFPAPLCILLLFEITFLVFSQSVGLSTYATLFVANRLFEIVLLYLIGCSLFRIHILRLQRKSKEPITDWRVRF
ncbi:MAG: hypothetical protein KDE05_08820, partial [Parvularculaceae bacterium]|nr:hypothetical protein [Parvularculaceae bacterium]